MFKYLVRFLIFTILTSSYLLLASNNDLRKIRKFNTQIKTFKGLASFTLRTHENTISGRVAVAGNKPNKFRITVLGPMGPLMSFSCSGKYLYFPDEKSKKIRKVRRKLLNLVHSSSTIIPVKPKELVSFLTGSILIYKYKKLIIEFNELTNEKMLILKDWDKNLKMIIFLRDDGLVSRVDYFHKNGRFKHRVEYSNYQTIGEFNVPQEITIENEDDVFLDLSFYKYWANIKTSSSMFKIEKSK